MNVVGMDSFAFRQWPDHPEHKDRNGTYIDRFTRENLIELVNKECPSMEVFMAKSVEGYAPFCRHLFLTNDDITTCATPVVKITEENRSQVLHGYKARKCNELPVLTRWMPKETISSQPAKYLDIIFYSREQCEKEAKAMQVEREAIGADRDWQIISIKAQTQPFETPMAPITMMRNSLIEEGGSGIPIDRSLYLKSVQFWSEHVMTG